MTDRPDGDYDDPFDHVNAILDAKAPSDEAEAPVCTTCRDTGLVPATRQGPDGYEPCPDCGPGAIRSFEEDPVAVRLGFREAEKDDGNAEPLFTGEVELVLGCRIVAVPYEVTRLVVEEGQRVAVYPADATPAPRAVTAEIVRLALADLAADVIGPFSPISPEDVAAAINERIGARPLPSAEEVEDAMAQGLTPGDQVNRVMALFAQPTDGDR